MSRHRIRLNTSAFGGCGTSWAFDGRTITRRMKSGRPMSTAQCLCLMRGAPGLCYRSGRGGQRMKTALLIALVLLGSQAWAWNEPDDFRGVPFGTPQVE